MHQPSPTEVSIDETFLSEVSTLARRFAGRSLLFADADDLAQDIVLDCLVELRDGKCPVVAPQRARFVRAIVLRRVLNAVRALKRRESRESDYARDFVERTPVWMSPELTLEENELDEFLERTQASLPKLCRQVYLLVREGELSYESVASVMGVTRTTVKSHVMKAQRRFRSALLETGHAAPPKSSVRSPDIAPRKVSKSKRRADRSKNAQDSAA